MSFRTINEIGVAGAPMLTKAPARHFDGAKHEAAYRVIVRRDGLTVRLYSRNAYDWTARLAAIAVAAELIKASD